MEMRLPFLTASILPVVVGTSLAWAVSGQFAPDLFLLTLVAGALLHLGANVSNDYFDHVSGADDINVDYVRPFSGGSRMIQAGLLSPRQVLLGSFVLFGVAGLIGLYLFLVRGVVILVLGGIGVASGFFYTAPPFRLVSRGVGEIFIGLNFGILMTLGSFYVQHPYLLIEPIIVSLPVAILITSVLYINEFPDVRADEAAGKRTLVVRLGVRGASRGYVILMLATYAMVVVPYLLGFVPYPILLGLASVPLAVVGSRTVLVHYDSPLGLMPAYPATILNHLLTGSGISLGYLLQGLMAPLSTVAVSASALFLLSVLLARRLTRPPRGVRVDQ